MCLTNTLACQLIIRWLLFELSLQSNHLSENNLAEKRQTDRNSQREKRMNRMLSRQEEEVEIPSFIHMAAIRRPCQKDLLIPDEFLDLSTVLEKKMEHSLWLCFCVIIYSPHVIPNLRLPFFLEQEKLEHFNCYVPYNI